MLCSAGQARCSLEAEAQAVILGLREVPEGCRVTVQMDRLDLIRCINAKSNGFNKSLQQAPFLASLLSLCATRLVKAVWVKG